MKTDALLGFFVIFNHSTGDAYLHERKAESSFRAERLLPEPRNLLVVPLWKKGD